MALALLCPIPAVAEADGFQKISVNGAKRYYKIRMPKPGSERVPALLVLHGGGGNAEQIEASVRLHELGEKEGFAVIYPEGTGVFAHKLLTWNAGGCCGSAVRQNVDDVAFLGEVIDDAIARYRIDPSRVYATGFSNGSQMSYRLACELSEKIAAVAPVGGQIVFSECRPKRPVPVMHVHGRRDHCASYDGGAACGGCFSSAFGFGARSDTFACPPVELSVESWAKHLHCTSDEIEVERGSYTCRSFTSCQGEAEVRLCTIENNGHHWPGSNGTPVCDKRPGGPLCKRARKVLGPADGTFDTNREIWKFLKRFSLPPASSR